MNRQGTQRSKRKARLRLTVELLESRRLMAGLNVLVFADNDGTRTLNSAVDTPAPNRLVYVDLNRTSRFEDGEPLAISGSDGIAKFPNLTAGNYLVGLAGHNPAQLQTTSVVSDASGKWIANADTQTLLTSDDLEHVWSVSPAGVVTRLGNSDVVGRSLSLGGPVISTAANHSASGGTVVWALVERGDAQPALMRLDLAAGSATDVALQQVPSGNKVVGIAMMGDELVVKLDSLHESFVGIVRVGDSSASIVTRIAAPRGRLVGSALANRVAVVGAENESSFSSLEVSETVALIETARTERPLTNVQYSADGQFVFASDAAGGLQVFSARNGLRSVAHLAEAAGPVAVSQTDGRVITGNATNREELIVWDSITWRPISRIAFSGQQGTIRALAIDQYGQRVLAATDSSIYSAGLANPVPMAVAVAGGNTTAEATLGVRISGRPVPLPGRVEIGKSFDEDTQLILDLASMPTLAAMGSATLMFAPSVNPRSGTMLVTPSGRLSYRPAPNSNGAQSAELRVFDGINTSTLSISLGVMPVNDAPSGFTVDALPVAEAARLAVAAGYTTVFDVDADANYLITTNDPRFYVLDGQLLRSDSGELDFETEPVVHLEVTATDVTNPAIFVTRSVSIPVLDSNDGPISFGLMLTTGISENTAGIDVGQLTIYEADGYGDYAFELSDDRFEIVGDKLRLKSGRALDYENEHSLQLAVTLRDTSAEINARPVSETFTIGVLDLNDRPESISIDTVQIKAHVPGAYVGTIQIADQDVLDEYTYIVSDPRFVVEGSALRLRENERVDGSAGKTIPVVVTATDSDGNVISETVSVQVINDAPSQNPRDPLDVDNDGHCYPRDVLILIDILNRKGPHIIEPQTGTGEGDNPAEDYYIDVNGDGVFTPLDALILINHLNTRGTGVAGEGESQSQTAPLIETKNEAARSESSDHTTTSLPIAEIDPISDDEVLASGPYQFDSYELESHDFVADYGFTLPTKHDREEIDGEIELLLDELSRERLR